MPFDLLEQPATWWRAGGHLVHAAPSCPVVAARAPLEAAVGTLVDVADPGVWCAACGGPVHAMLRAWHRRNVAAGQPRPALVELPHPAMQQPGRWILNAVSDQLCCDTVRLTRWVVRADGDTSGWLRALADPSAPGDVGVGVRVTLLGPQRDLPELAGLWRRLGGPGADLLAVSAALTA